LRCSRLPKHIQPCSSSQVTGVPSPQVGWDSISDSFEYGKIETYRKRLSLDGSEIRFKVTVDEFLGGQRIFNRYLAPPSARFSYRYAVPVGVLLLADAAVGFALRWSTSVCLFLVAFGGYLIAFRTIIGPGRAMKEFAQHPDLAADREMEFGEDKILVQTSHGKSEIDWGRFTRFVETDTLFVLFAPPRFLYTIPKRVFSSIESAQFSELLRRKLPSK
jgi:hypothetical protein